MCTNCAPLVAGLFLFCYERDFMMSLSTDKDTEIIEALDDLLNIDNVYFDGMVKQIYPLEFQLNKANPSTAVPFLDLHLTISNGFVSSKMYDKCDNFDFNIVNCPFFGIFLALNLTGFIYHSLFGLLECLSLTLTLDIKF